MDNKVTIDTTYNIIPITKIIYPFDSIYNYESKQEKEQFLFFQFQNGNKCIEHEPIQEDKYRICPTLSQDISYGDHVLQYKYISHFICFADSSEEIKNCINYMRQLYSDITSFENKSIGYAMMSPMFSRNEHSIFRGYIISKSKYNRYASPFDFSELPKQVYFAGGFLISDKKLNLKILENKEHNIILLGLSKNFENNPDVLKVVKLSDE